MLASTSYSVARIAGDVGYESEPAFNRAFKREFGAPPAHFRNQAKADKARKESAPEPKIPARIRVAATRPRKHPRTA